MTEVVPGVLSYPLERSSAMRQGCRKYKPFAPIALPDRTWPDKTITQAPVWCSVDLRDGNQALVNPMNLEQKLEFFQTLCEIGFTEIEVGFPASSETEYEILRALIDHDLIPDGVTVQVLVQAREHLIRKTFEAIRGAKNVIIHFYNSTSTLQRRVVFHTDMEGVIQIAVDAARLIRRLTEEHMAKEDVDIRYEYSPESFSGTEVENSVRICDRVLEELGASPERKVILNLPNTVELSTPNTYADQIEYVCRHLKHRDCAIVSLHPHNDRGTATAATELGLMAGAERVEGTLFGNGERTGNADIMNLALNLYSQGVDPNLDFSHMNHIKRVYEECTGMKVHQRHPYAGELVFTAFSGSHQDAIKKGLERMQNDADAAGIDLADAEWRVPYLPIDPKDVGRSYEAVIRVNSQSGKGGMAYLLRTEHGLDLPRRLQIEFSGIVQHRTDSEGGEVTPEQLWDVFTDEYLPAADPTRRWGRYSFRDVHQESTGDGADRITVSLVADGEEHQITGIGNGPLDGFVKALAERQIDVRILDYAEHALTEGDDSLAASYIECEIGERIFWGVGIDGSITRASLEAIISALNREHRAR
ncbi:MAG TPA: 2-isopropylmalate synthase [Candidatus Brachybacterium merdigallinarum]|nr:2-isopropylmalate synthase [Candidatus Brachybacterium merdigallinarum]